VEITKMPVVGFLSWSSTLSDNPAKVAAGIPLKERGVFWANPI